MNRVFYDEYGNRKVISSSMKILYDEDDNKLLLNTENGIVGYGLYGVVYKINEDTCLKYITNDHNSHPEVIKTIMKLDLASFYKIYKLLYDCNNDFSGYIMKYYEEEEIDITTMPTDYTLDNLNNINKDIKTITDNGILLKDLHSGNSIINNDKITIIDVDNSMFYCDENLLKKNIQLIYSLFKEIYIDHIEKSHLVTLDELRTIRKLFNYDNSIYNELKNYKYPIDYIKKKSLEPTKYTMRKY